jgi:hypothetical protein
MDWTANVGVGQRESLLRIFIAWWLWTVGNHWKLSVMRKPGGMQN